MQANKDYQEKLFANFQLSERIPKNNSYRRFKEVLEFQYLYKLTEGYYGYSGQKSIDPLVFLSYVWWVIWRISSATVSL